MPSRRSERLGGPAAMLLALLVALPAAAADWSGFVRAPAEARRLAPARPWTAGVQHAAATTCQEEGCVTCAAWSADESGRRGDTCDDEAQACQDALQKLFGDRLASVELDIRVGGRPGSDYPCECRLEGETYEPRRFASTTFTWTAAGYCHKPLYFEDWNLERYGHSYGPLADPFLSAAHFFVRLPVLPYQMGVELPWECVYPLGYYRPGNCAPWTVPAVPISARGLAVEAATITGLVFLLP